MDDFFIRFYEIPDICFAAVGLLERICCLLMIYFSSKYRSGYPRAGWYIFGFFFPFVTGVIFLFKRKEMGAPDMKSCPICKSKYPKDFTYCHKCNVELGEYDPKKKKTQKTFSVLFAVVFLLCGAVTLANSSISLIAWNYYPPDDGEVEEYVDPGINIDGAYYDRDGNSYMSFYDIPFYTKDGKRFAYSNATERYESQDGYLNEYDCVVGEDGYLCATPADELDYVSDDLSGDAYYEDAEHNKYYSILLIGWNENGELLLRSDADRLDYEVIGRTAEEE